MKLQEAADIMARLGSVRRKGAYRKPVPKDWQLLEKALKGAIPQSFKDFAAVYNGAMLPVAVVDLADSAFAKQGGLEVLTGFAGTHSLIRELKGFEGRMPGGFLPFGHGGTGNHMCLDTNTKRGAVYYWDHELEHLGPWGCVAKASSSFDAFLRSLQPLELQ